MEEAKRVNETIEQWTELSQENELKKRAGMYVAKDVDRYIEKLHFNMRNMETAYHERFEEMRTLLMSVNRERDEYQNKVQKLEQSLRGSSPEPLPNLKRRVLKHCLWRNIRC